VRGAIFRAVLDERIDGIEAWEGVTARGLKAKKERVAGSTRLPRVASTRAAGH